MLVYSFDRNLVISSPDKVDVACAPNSKHIYIIASAQKKLAFVLGWKTLLSDLRQPTSDVCYRRKHALRTGKQALGEPIRKGGQH
jgi:hypothetical protein